MTLTVRIASLLLLAALVIARPAAAERYEFTRGDARSLVMFVSRAPMETFDGKTRAISGHIEVTPQAIGDSVTVELSIDLASFDTGIDLRNRHIRENHLETERYPIAMFTGAEVISPKPVALTPGQTTSFEIAGTLDLHGVARRMRVKVDVTLNEPASELSIHAEFRVVLADHNIKRPTFLFLKLEEAQTVTVDAVASRVTPLAR